MSKLRRSYGVGISKEDMRRVLTH